jgi:hypothetical protein
MSTQFESLPLTPEQGGTIVHGTAAAVREYVGFDAIQVFRGEYYEAVTGTEPGSSDVFRYIDATTEASWDDPNLGPRRSFRRDPRAAAVVAADGQLEGIARTAQDTSATYLKKLPKPIRHIEEAAKQRIDRLIDARYFWFREIIGATGVRNAMAGMLMAKYAYAEQPVSMYPYDIETDLIESAESWGMTELKSDREADATQMGTFELRHYVGRPAGRMVAALATGDFAMIPGNYKVVDLSRSRS